MMLLASLPPQNNTQSSLQELTDLIIKRAGDPRFSGLDGLICGDSKARYAGDMSLPRSFELASAINRWRQLSFH